MSYNKLSFGVLYNKWIDTATGMLTTPVLQWMSTSLIPAINNTTPLTIPGPFANDAAAAAASVPVGAAYYQASGAVVARLV
jgi:hypothetical protein